MKTIKLYWLYSLFIFATLMSSCGSKDKDASPSSGSSDDYQPTTKGSTWTYRGQVSYTINITGAEKNFNGKTYKESETVTNGRISKAYYYKENGSYYSRGTVTNNLDMEMIYLKDNVPVGAQWEHKFTINNVPTTYRFKIIGKGLTKEVEGKTYKDVIAVEMTSIFNYPVVGEMELTATNYHAKGVGFIMQEPDYAMDTYLVSYTIK